jgi:hypothetical protein
MPLQHDMKHEAPIFLDIWKISGDLPTKYLETSVSLFF